MNKLSIISNTKSFRAIVFLGLSIFLTSVEPALAQTTCPSSHTGKLQASELMINLTPTRSQPFTIEKKTGRRHFEHAGWLGEKAEIHVLKIGDHEIEVMSAIRDDLGWTLESVVQSMTKLPLKHIKAVKTVRINAKDSLLDVKSRQTVDGFTRAAARAGQGRIDIYPVSLKEIVDLTPEGNRLLRHEFGHLLAEKVFGSMMPNDRYIQIAQNDPRSVSPYGDTSWAEDFAEAVEAYIRTNAGLFQPEIRNALLGRFSFLDEVFAGRRPQNLKSESQSPKLPSTFFVDQLNVSHLFVYSIEKKIGIVLDLR